MVVVFRPQIIVVYQRVVVFVERVIGFLDSLINLNYAMKPDSGHRRFAVALGMLLLGGLELEAQIDPEGARLWELKQGLYIYV